MSVCRRVPSDVSCFVLPISRLFGLYLLFFFFTFFLSPLTRTYHLSFLCLNMPSRSHRNNDPKSPYTSTKQLSCRACPLGASCSGDFVTFQDVTARSGFRRLSWNHSVFGACPVSEACEGVPDVLNPNTGEVLSVGSLSRGLKDELERCRSGHAQDSELCSDCDSKYLVRVSASPAGTCSKCPAGGTNFLMFFALILVALGYMSFLIMDSLAGAKEMIEKNTPMPFHTIAIRIMSSYLQVAGMLMSFRITLPLAVANLVTVQRSASAVVEQTLSFDCTAGSRRGLDLFFMKQTLAVLLPLLLPLVGCVWILANAWKRMRGQKLIQFLNDKIVASVVVLYYLVFPAIVSRIAITFACTEFGDDGFNDNKRYLMQNSLTTQCYSTVHAMHIFTVTTPAILLYMLMIPGYLIYELHRLRKKEVLYSYNKNYEPAWTYRYGFLYAGYEPNYAFWEIVVLMRKAAFVLVTVFTRPAGMAAQVVAAVLVLILSLSAHIHFSPYDHDSHDVLESASLHANLITLPVALLANEMSVVYGTGTIGEGGQQILGSAESVVFSLTAFLSFGSFIYLFFHGILMEKVDDPGTVGKLSRAICKCWHPKDQSGHIVRIKPSRSKSERRKKINLMTSVHGSNGISHLVAMGLDHDEVAAELNRSHPNRGSDSGGDDVSGAGSQVKVQPILPREEKSSSTPIFTARDKDEVTVAATMGSAYLELFPNDTRLPRGAAANEKESNLNLLDKVETRKADETTEPVMKEKPVETGKSTRSGSGHFITNGNAADRASAFTSKAKNAPQIAPMDSKPDLNQITKLDQAAWLQDGYVETLSNKELKKAYKSAKAEALADPENESKLNAYTELKARYVQLKGIKSSKNDSQGSNPAVAGTITATTSNGDEGGGKTALSAESLVRRLRRARNKLKGASGGFTAAVKTKRQSQTLVI